MPDDPRAWLKTLLATIPNGIVFLDAEWRVRWANDAAARQLLGGSADNDKTAPSPEGAALAGRSLEAFFPSPTAFVAFREGAVYGIERAGRDRREILLRHPGEGGEWWAEACSARCHRDTRATWAVSLVDITPARALERELRDRQASQSYLKRETLDLIVRLDADARIEYANPAATAVVCEGERFEDNLGPDAHQVWAATWSALRDARRSDATLETALQRGGATVAFVRWLFRRLEDQAGAFAGVSAIGHDETERYGIRLLSEQAGLSPREVEVLEYVVAGYTNLNIAALLGLSESGVKFHLRSLFAKTKVASRTELMGLVMPTDALRKNLWRG